MLNYEFIRKNKNIPDNYWDYECYSTIKGVINKYNKNILLEAVDNLRGLHDLQFECEDRLLYGYIQFEAIIVTANINDFLKFTDSIYLESTRSIDNLGIAIKDLKLDQNIFLKMTEKSMGFERTISLIHREEI